MAPLPFLLRKPELKPTLPLDATPPASSGSIYDTP
jgi:hypothetical protein